MKCKRCHCDGVFSRRETVTFKKKHGLLWWLLIGWWWYLVFAWWVWIFLPKKKTWQHTVHYCNKCGYQW